MAEQGRKKEGRRKEAVPAKAETVAFDYIKSNMFRVIHVDGVIGGLAPAGGIHMAIWTQRQPYPQRVVQEVLPDGSIGKEVARTQRETDIIRELEAGLVFDASMARAMIKWLERQLEELEGIPYRENLRDARVANQVKEKE